ncbi:hypothetical protein L1987_31113 [Smallanthus sonchifolius]|uniref:Uncharacterized protein n=1 Tax=Smallanthus sonchifolius TaxID=185202 RepID=A0ACB9I5Z8_9ASTR|nr:hypothetical protein L1987_31113 [Smallanthus sonchifolius]
MNYARKSSKYAKGQSHGILKSMKMQELGASLVQQEFNLSAISIYTQRSMLWQTLNGHFFKVAEFLVYLR